MTNISPVGAACCFCLDMPLLPELGAWPAPKSINMAGLWPCAPRLQLLRRLFDITVLVNVLHRKLGALFRKLHRFDGGLFRLLVQRVELLVCQFTFPSELSAQ